MATDELTTWQLAAETKEWVGPISVLADGIPTTSFELSVTGPGARPATWVTPTAIDVDGGPGVLVGTGTTFPLQAGRKYTVWVRLTDSPEVPVKHVGLLRVY